MPASIGRGLGRVGEVSELRCRSELWKTRVQRDDTRTTAVLHALLRERFD